MKEILDTKNGGIHEILKKIRGIREILTRIRGIQKILTRIREIRECQINPHILRRIHAYSEKNPLFHRNQ